MHRTRLHRIRTSRRRAIRPELQPPGAEGGPRLCAARRPGRGGRLGRRPGRRDLADRRHGRHGPHPDRAGRGPGRVLVAINGRPLVAFGPAEAIEVRGHDGDDIILGGRVGLPIRIEGDNGSDRMVGGAGPDQLIGVPETTCSSPARAATRDAGPGRNRVVVPQKLGTIWIGPSLRGVAARSGPGGEALGLLASTYRLAPLRPNAGGPAGPIVVGPADLEDAAVVAALRQAYEAGNGVALLGPRRPRPRRSGAVRPRGYRPVG